ncbi:MarR family winged helix-turn-helix transcriptional regulator [Dyadobacter sp. CY356]|uniref:MarR family winged helix-turn-helix transcriptional regulator n=1 Tax=Dyadobacter sp. CY356 TaxID=2906442 RepID=UPI001F40BEB7|nr:MarR family winged helix-turn-helix transcriptional regulator [Dyadobacter sp. CY356]MCF0054838.1 MarR family winged helix-turn-helix transcriptional regulator [Dyadobacter sp. CY356]
MENHINTRFLFKVIYILKRLTDEWGENVITQYIPGFKMGYIPVFMCIGTEGVSNNEVARELKITKMAASKIIKELFALKLIASEKDPLDARSERIFLTAKGKEISAKVKESADSLVEEYRKVTGDESYESAIDVLLTITRYHEEAKSGTK